MTDYIHNIPNKHQYHNMQGMNYFAIAVVLLVSFLIYITVFSDGLGKGPDLNFKTQSGETYNLSKPKIPVLVTFWATTCPGCIEEMPQLALIKNHLQDRFELIAVAMDYDPEKQVKKFIESNNFPFNYVHDKDGAIAKAFGGVLLTPTSFLIAPNGNIVYRKIGEVDFDVVEKRIKELSPEL